ncbi:MAG: YraN family protein [Clostridia bacterium]|nr:YraN family protein [Clostridia bacterium]
MNILGINTEKRKLGSLGEDEAARYLKKKGYKILERNYAPFDSEIDIIAKDRVETVFIEVKTRSTDKSDPRETRPASAITPEKMRAIISAAKVYMAYHPEHGKLRFDVVEVYVRSEGGKTKVERINHIEGAFNNNTAHPSRFSKRYRG